MDQILTKEAILDLGLGSTSISMIDVPTASFSAADFSQGDLIYTLKDSLNVQQEAPDETDITLDQNDEVLDTVYKAGKIKFAGNFPSNAAEALGYFYTEKESVTGIKGADGTTTYSGKGFDTYKPKTVIKALLFESQSKETAFILARTRINATIVPIENSDTPFYIALDGTALPSTLVNGGNIYVLKQPGTTSDSGD